MPCALIISSCTVDATPRLVICGAAIPDSFGRGLSQAVHLHFKEASQITCQRTVIKRSCHR